MEKSFTRDAGTVAPKVKDFSVPRLRRSSRNDWEEADYAAPVEMTGTERVLFGAGV